MSREKDFWGGYKLVGETIPLYFHIYPKLKQKIMSGEYAKGSTISSIEALAKQHKVAQETVRKALKILESEGLLVRKSGMGTIIPESADLRPVEIVNLISVKNVAATVRASEVFILSAEWVAPNARIRELYELRSETSDPLIYKIYHKHVFPKSMGLIGVLTNYVSEELRARLHLKKNFKPHEVLIKMSEWIENNPITLEVSLRPYLCIGEVATLLGVNDSTPVFSQEFIYREKKGPCHMTEMITNANIHYQKVELK
jgi:DNA-binding transcriptional regulator YhcF (GntR family)/predicted DNA-binding transcriptional regulator AlpA